MSSLLGWGGIGLAALVVRGTGRGKAGAAMARRLQDFEGVWAFERRIVHADGQEARVTGRAVWSREGTGLDHVETGEMRLPGAAPMRVARRYRWEEGPRVYFTDGRFFHDVPAEGGETHHWCDPDRYDGRYDFGPWPDFTVTWVVRGPRKDYRMVTRYTREPA